MQTASGSTTYRTCSTCFGSGPIEKECKKCNEGVYRMKIMEEKKVVDAQWISELFGGGHEEEKGCRIWDFTGDKYYDLVSEDELEEWISRRYDHVKDTIQKRNDCSRLRFKLRTGLNCTEKPK